MPPAKRSIVQNREPRRARGLAADCGALDASGLSEPHVPGRLILLTSADLARLEFVASAVSRRFGPRQGLCFVTPIVSRQLPSGGGTVLSRSSIRSLEASGTLALSWRRDGRSCGYTVGMLARLDLGETIVAAAPIELEAQARELAADCTIIRVVSGTEAMRSALQRRGNSPANEQRADLHLHDRSDVASIVMALSEAIRPLLPDRRPTLDASLPLRSADVAPPAEMTASRLPAGRRRLDRGEVARRPLHHPT